MEKLVKGDIVVIPFPFSDLSGSKKRPAFVLAELRGNDVILCQITSQTVNDDYSIVLKEKDFASGTLHQVSNVRPNRIFTADKNIIIKIIGRANSSFSKKVTEKIFEILS